MYPESKYRNRFQAVSTNYVTVEEPSARSIASYIFQRRTGMLTRFLWFTAITVTFALAMNARAAELFVSTSGSDSDDGSLLHPWATIQRAALAVKPGATVHVSAGTYLGPIRTTVSGTASARIRFVSDKRWAARVRSIGAETVWRNDGDYVTVEGFDISGDGAYGLQSLASYDQIIGNHVHNIPASGCTGQGGAGILIGNFSAHDSDTIGNIVHDIGNPDVKCFEVHGIYYANRGGKIYNNIAYRNQGWGIHLWHAAREQTIANNLVFRNGAGGVVVGAGDSPGGVTCEGVVVINNIIVDNISKWSYGYAISELGQTGQNTYSNNLIHGNSAYVRIRRGDANGTVNADPRFVNYRPDGSGDYHLKAGSPAIDAGVSSLAPQDDIDNRPRPIGRGWDIGPYEWTP
jgi:parallel beta-helix repeat protein